MDATNTKPNDWRVRPDQKRQYQSFFSQKVPQNTEKRLFKLSLSNKDLAFDVVIVPIILGSVEMGAQPPRQGRHFCSVFDICDLRFWFLYYTFIPKLADT